MATETVLMLGALATTFVLLVLASIRNDWVLAKRIHIIESNGSLHENYASYETMLLMFWIFDIEKFRLR